MFDVKHPIISSNYWIRLIIIWRKESRNVTSRCYGSKNFWISTIFLDRDVKRWKKSLGFRFVPGECNHAQESHTCIFFVVFFFCHISSTADCWDPEIMLPWQRDLTPCLHYGGRGGWYQPRWMTLFSRRCYLCPYKRLILGKGAFFILVFLNMITNPIISQTLNFCDVAPLFSVLLKIV